MGKKDKNMKIKNWKEYLNKDVECGCKRVHRCNIDDIIIEAGALSRIPEVLSRYDYRKICIVSDTHTNEVAGKAVCRLLEQSGYAYSQIIFTQEELVPDEHIIGSFLIEIPNDCDLILAVGSGSINDLCKFVSFKLKIDYFIIGTAPSMDGYASNVAPLIVKDLKTTYEVGMPKVIIGDLDILCQAPITMIAAGAGDILGKYVCLADWKMAHLVTGEYYCEYVESLIRESIEAVVSGVDKACERDREAVGSIMEGLVLSGIAMSYVGNSRPASGSEHHLSHYWEMQSLFGGSHGALHGTKVGIGTVLGLHMYRVLPDYLEQTIISKKEDTASSNSFSYENWAVKIKEAYLQAAPQVLVLECQVHKNSDEEVQKRIGKLIEHMGEIIELIHTLPKAETIIELLKKMEAPYLPVQIGVDNITLKNSVLYAKDLRNRFGLLQLLYDINKIEEMSERIVRDFSCQ